MSQSLSKIYIHLVFNTKGRQPLIYKNIKKELHAYMAGILKRHECPALIINSVPDHIHILFRMSKKITLATIVEEVKKNSSRWMKKHTGNSTFYWQKGYGAFSVSSSGVDAVIRYIARQEEHHARVSYREEVERFVRAYDVVEYNPEYFWE